MRTPILALLIAASAQAATVTYTNFATDYTDGNVYTDLTLKQFDSALGTLTGVNVTINQLSIAGYFSIAADVDSDATLLGFVDSVRLQSKGSTALGFTSANLSRTAGTNLTITPGINTVVSAGTTTQFNLTPQTLLTSDVRSISSGVWSNYTGTGNVTFQLRNSSNITNSFDFQPVVNTGNLSAYANMSVTYTYDAAVVPEPSTYGLMLGGLALAATAIRRRRKALKA